MAGAKPSTLLTTCKVPAPRSVCVKTPSSTVTFLQQFQFCRGCKQHIQSCTNEDTEWCWWYHGWSPWRTCQVELLTSCYLSVFLQFQMSFSIHVRWVFDHLPTQIRRIFDNISIQIHWFSMFFSFFMSVTISTTFRSISVEMLNSTSTNFMDYDSSLMIDYDRTMFI